MLHGDLGPNGLGKSNVLDAICFNLGITDLSKVRARRASPRAPAAPARRALFARYAPAPPPSLKSSPAAPPTPQVRAENLNALIYKSGQAGVTKATVTLIWDNTDAGQSPHGYESHAQITVTRQIVLGGRSKYMINGTTAQLQRVMNLDHSVQLNVNNPHFLIMQGRIAKVINMKPVEVLGMIEEAAGTRMFQNKKENAQKTIQKKEVKVAEIDRVISQDIKPKLEKHKSERVQFVECASRRVSDTGRPHAQPSITAHPAPPSPSRYANKTAEVEEHTRFMQAHQLSACAPRRPRWKRRCRRRRRRARRRRRRRRRRRPSSPRARRRRRR